MSHPTMTADSPIVLAIDGQDDDTDNEPYLLDFWLPVVGPTALAIRTVTLHELAGETPAPLFCWDTTIDALAWRVGAGVDAVANILWRAARHGFWHHEDRHARWAQDSPPDCVWTIPRQLGTIPDRELAKRSAAFRQAHERYLARR